ncbi:hypothetical protein INS49_013909 [Diaporthe citri]|uniref:uncharacterized protein n=1 Tax=Diaporthe citri TaxID=83186 RepID=UPI001C8182CF|nr:uncharacterized protein INS49_013909 [Diaporthe citri]KAG6358025.1 hypothetical protein INS49_013909 [Diaporthe citri]
MVPGNSSCSFSLGDGIREALRGDQIEVARLLPAIADFSVDSSGGRSPMPTALSKRGPGFDPSELAPAAKRCVPGNGPKAVVGSRTRQRAPIAEPDTIHIDDDDQSRHSGQDTDSSDGSEREDAVYGALGPTFEQANVLIEQAIERMEALSDSTKLVLDKLNSVVERTGSTEKWLRMLEKWEVMAEKLDALPEKEGPLRAARSGPASTAEGARAEPTDH